MLLIWDEKSKRIIRKDENAVNDEKPKASKPRTAKPKVEVPKVEESKPVTE